MKVYLMMDDDPFSRRNIVLVGSRNIVLVETEEQAKAMVENTDYGFYEEINVFTNEDVKEVICDNRLSTMDNAVLFHEIYCNECSSKYDEDCPYMDY